MSRDVFNVKNTTISDIELIDFGIIIPSGITVDLCSYDKSLLSDELNSYLISGDLVRIINGNEVSYDESYLITNESYITYDTNYIQVSKTGGTYNTIQDAIDSITDASTTNRYYVYVNSGNYQEDITLKSYVFLEGLSNNITRIYGDISINMTEEDDITKLKDIQILTTNRPTLNIDTNGYVYLYDCNLYNTWTNDTSIKTTFDIKGGKVHIGGQSNIYLTDNYTGTTITNTFCYYVNGSDKSVSFRSDKTVHMKYIYGNYQKFGLLYNTKDNSSNLCTIKDSITESFLYGNFPENVFYTVYHSGSTSQTSIDAVNIRFESDNIGSNVLCIGAYNEYSNDVSGSTIDLSFCSFDWNENISDENVYIGSVITDKDQVKLISCNFETSEDVIPIVYTDNGNNGTITYNIYNGVGTIYNSDLILTDKLSVGDTNSLVINDISDDITLSDSSVSKLVTQNAIKTYVDNQIPDDAHELIYSNIGWTDTSGTTGDFIDDLSNVITHTNGTGYIGIQDTVQQTGNNEITVLSGAGYISYDNIHKYISWSGFTIDTTTYDEGSWCICFDEDNNLEINTSGTTFFDKIQIAQFYKTGNVLGGVQSSGRRLDSINTRFQDYAFRMGSFIYDDGGSIEILGSITGDTAMKLNFTPCKVQNVTDSYTITGVTSNEGTTNFFVWFIDSDVSAKIDYSAIINNDGKINTKSYNNLNGQSDYQITGGTLSFTQYTKIVTSTSNLTGEVNIGDYLYAQSHTSVYMNRVDDIDYNISGTTITLEFNYLGSTITGTTGILVKSLEDIPLGKYVKHLIIRASDGKTHMIYGQQYYDSRSDALSAPLPGYNNDIERFTIKVGAIIVTPGMTSLGGQIVDLRPLPFSSTSLAGGGITTHGALSGLLEDDHTQYLLTDGTRNITGKISYNDNKTFTSDNEIISKKYVDDNFSVTGHTHMYFNNDLIIYGNLTVSGITTTINAEDINVSDNMILINSGETGIGVSKGTAGIEIDRGTETNYRFIFDDLSDSFKIGEIGSLQKVATREDSPTDGNIATWNDTLNRFDTSVSTSDFAASTHNHIISDITDLSTNYYNKTETNNLLDNKSTTGHTHTESDIIDLSSYNGFTNYYNKTNVDILLDGKANTGQTITWNDIDLTGSTIADLEIKDAVDVDYTESNWNITNVEDGLNKITDYIENTQGTGRLEPENVLSGLYGTVLTISGGTGFINYENFHKKITWSTTTIETSGDTEGTYYVYVDSNSDIKISTTLPDPITNIILGFYYQGGFIGVIQQYGCIIKSSTNRIVDFALRQGIFIYDNGGKIEILSGDNLKVVSTACKVQFGLLSSQLSQIDSNDASGLTFLNYYNSNDYGLALDWYFCNFNQGRIPTNRWNDVTKNSYEVLTGYTASFTFGSNTVTSTSDLTSLDLENSYIYEDNDSDVYMTPVSAVTWDGTGTTITLENPYYGTSTGSTIAVNYAIPKLPNGKYAKHLIVRSSDGLMYLVMSQQYFDSQDDAISGSLPSIDESLVDVAIKMAYIVNVAGETDLTGKIYDIRPLPFQYREGGQIGGGITITNHGDLTGLSNDDHLQYLRSDGSRNLTGIQRYNSQPTFTTDLDIITKKYVDDGLDTKSNTSHTHTVSNITDLSTNYYNKTQINNFFSGTTSISGYNKTNWDTAYTNTHTHSNKSYLDAVGNNTIWHTGNLNKDDTNLISNKLIVHREIGKSSIIAGSGQGDYSLYLDSLSSGTTHINHYTSSDLFMVHGGGNVAIGATDFDILNPQKLLVESFSESVNIISAKGNLDDYLQLDIQNRSGGTYSSADIVASNDLSTEDSYYVNIGINSSNYNDTDFSMSGPNDSYLYASGGHLSIATETVNKYIKFFVGGTTSSDQRAILDTDGNFGINSSTFTSKLQIADRLSKIGQTPNILSLRSDDTSSRMELLFTRNSNTSWDIQSIEQTVENKLLRLNPNGGDVSVNDYSIWHAGNFDPDSKADTGTTLNDYGITDAYTVSETNNLLDEKSFTGHTHTELDITDLDHNAQKIKDVVVDDSNISDGNVLIYDEISDTIKYKSVLDTMPSIQAIRTTDFSVTTTWSDITFSLTDIQNKPSVLYWDNINTERFYVVDNGYYNLIFQTKVTCTTTTTQTSVQMLMNGTDFIEGSDTYVNVYQGEVHPLISSTIAYLSGGTYITVQVIRNETSSTLLANPKFIMYKMDGIKGEKGDTGSGSNIYVQSSGTTVLNGPHSTLNFTGVNVNVSDSGGGTAEVNIDVSSILSSLQIERTTNFISTTTWQNITFDTTVVETDSDNLYLDSLNTDRIYLEKGGVYYISTKVIPTDGTSQRHDIRLIKNGTTFIDGTDSFIDIYSSESHELTINTLFNAVDGDYITLQGQSEVGGTFQSDTSMLLIRLEGIKGDKGEKGDTVIGPEGPSGEKGEIGYGLFAYAKVQSNGTLDGYINLNVSRISTGVYDYTFLTGTTDITYGVYAQPFGTTTDTNSQISNITTSGFTVSLGVGDNGGTNDVLTDTDHSVVVFGPPSILSGATGGSIIPLTVEDEGVDVGVTSVENINFIGDLVTATNGGGNTVDVTISNPTNSPVIIQDESTNVANTPHTTLNFTGNGVTVSDGGSGVADITIENVYGSEFQTASDLTVSTTTSTSPVTKTTLNTTDLPSGTYKISANWVFTHSDNNQAPIFDITLNGTALGTTSQIDPQTPYYGTGSWYSSQRVFYRTLSGNNTIILRYWSENGTCSISDATIELIRVS